MSLVRLSPLQACLTFLSTSFVSICIEWAKENFNENNETMKYLFIYFSYTTMCNFINVMFLYMKKNFVSFSVYRVFAKLTFFFGWH